jgi:hypothetical protein
LQKDSAIFRKKSAKRRDLRGGKIPASTIIFAPMKFFLPIILSLVAAVALAQSAAPFFPEEMVVTASTLNLREAPDKNAKKIASLPLGTLVQFVEAHNNGEYVSADTTDENAPWAPWLKIRHQGKTGWVFGAYLKSSVSLYYEQSFFFNDEPLPPTLWYGVYTRDSFADEIRRVQVRLVEEPNEFYGGNIKVLKTNQKEQSKFLVATNSPLREGYCGSLGMFDTNQVFYSQSLGPGDQTSIFPGNDINDTIIKPAYGLVATGCATFDGTMMSVNNYQLTLLDYALDPFGKQDLTPWVKTDAPEVVPMVELLWFGDLDGDQKPDAIIQDSPYGIGARASLFLSSKAKRGEYLRKISEYQWPME